MTQYDVIVIGAGHNGLVCAAELARQGQRVCVVEAGGHAGGLASTYEFAPGFKTSAGAHLLYALHPQIYRRFRLRDFGLTFSNSHMSTVVLNNDGEQLTLFADERKTCISIETRSDNDAKRWQEFRRQTRVMSDVLFKLFTQLPPRFGEKMDRQNAISTAEKISWVRLAMQFKGLDRADAQAFLRVIGMNIADLVEENFESDLLRAVLAFDATLGVGLGPHSPNSAYTWLHRMAGVHKHVHGISHPVGGMGAVSDALLASARSMSVDIIFNARVREILLATGTVDQDAGMRAVGVSLDSAEAIVAKKVVSSLDTHNTFMNLIGPQNLDTGFVRKIGQIPTRSGVAKINIALNGLPTFAEIDPPAMRGRLVVADNVNHIERAFNASKYNELAERPVMEIIIPTLDDATLAPPGQHVMSVLVPHVPSNVTGGWDAVKDSFQTQVLRALKEHVPELAQHILHIETVTPLDFESRFGVKGGHWHHGEMGLERFFMLRPIPGWARYRTPVENLYMCGASCHPGGHVSGASGLNAATAVMADIG